MSKTVPILDYLSPDSSDQDSTTGSDLQSFRLILGVNQSMRTCESVLRDAVETPRRCRREPAVERFSSGSHRFMARRRARRGYGRERPTPTTLRRKRAGMKTLKAVLLDVDDADALEILTAELLEDTQPDFATAVGYPAPRTRTKLLELRPRFQP